MKDEVESWHKKTAIFRNPLETKRLRDEEVEGRGKTRDLLEKRKNHGGVLCSGNYFGEMALVNDSPRSATATSIGNGILLSLDKESFDNIFTSNEQALTEFKLRLLGG